MFNIIKRGKDLFWGFVRNKLSANAASITYFSSEEERSCYALVHEIRQKASFLLSDQEAIQLFFFARSIARLPGDVAEVGTFQGGSAKLLSRALPEKQIFTFDTFEGLPTTETLAGVVQGEYRADHASVTRFLEDSRNVSIIKGYFPGSATSISERTFCFVHMDTDLYQSTYDSLSFFYPKMARGGILISHDYLSNKGVRKAFDDFFADKMDPVFSVVGATQGFVVKTGN